MQEFFKNIQPKGRKILAGKEDSICKGSLDLAVNGEDCAHHPVQMAGLLFVLVVWACMSVAQGEDRLAGEAGQAAQARATISQVEGQISTLSSKLDNLEVQKERFQSELGAQESLLSDLDRLKIQKQAELSMAQQRQEVQAQELSLNNQIVLSQLQNDVVKQQAAVAAIQNQVQWENQINIDSDTADADRATLAQEQNRLQDLRSQWMGTQAQMEVDRMQRQQQMTETMMNQRSELQTLDRQKQEAANELQKLQANRDTVEAEEKATQDNQAKLEEKKRMLINQLS